MSACRNGASGSGRSVSINDAGQIVGQGRITGEMHAIVLTPVHLTFGSGRHSCLSETTLRVAQRGRDRMSCPATPQARPGQQSHASGHSARVDLWPLGYTASCPMVAWSARCVLDTGTRSQERDQRKTDDFNFTQVIPIKFAISHLTLPAASFNSYVGPS